MRAARELAVRGMTASNDESEENSDSRQQQPDEPESDRLEANSDLQSAQTDGHSLAPTTHDPSDSDPAPDETGRSEN